MSNAEHQHVDPDRPVTTLFLLQSVDGKISTGANDDLDFDADLPHVAGVGAGLHQYYDIEKTTDYFSMCSGKVQAKIGINSRLWTDVDRMPVSFVLIDNRPHLDAHGVEYFAHVAERLIVVTNNSEHPAFRLSRLFPNVHVMQYEGVLNLGEMFRRLKTEYSADRVTIQTGGTLNAMLLQADLVDYVSIVVAPLFVGGHDTPSLVDGPSRVRADLPNLRSLSLDACEILGDSYLHLRYRVNRPN